MATRCFSCSSFASHSSFLRSEECLDCERLQRSRRTSRRPCLRRKCDRRAASASGPASVSGHAGARAARSPLPARPRNRPRPASPPRSLPPAPTAITPSHIRIGFLLGVHNERAQCTRLAASYLTRYFRGGAWRGSGSRHCTATQAAPMSATRYCATPMSVGVPPHAARHRRTSRGTSGRAWRGTVGVPPDRRRDAARLHVFQGNACAVRVSGMEREPLRIIVGDALHQRL